MREKIKTERLWKTGIQAVIVPAAFFCSSNIALAQSSVKLYGILDVYAGTQRALGGARAYAMNSGGMSTSFWGMGGREDLGAGYAAVFALEAFIRPSTGATGRFSGDTFFGRNAYVGLTTPYGSVLLGRNTTPYYVSALRFNPFGTSFGFSPTLIQMYKGVSGQGLVGDNGWSNSVMYTTPTGADLHAGLIYAAGNEAGHPGANQWGGNVVYGHGPFSATVAFQQAKYDKVPGDLSASIPGFSNQDALFVGVSYNANFARVTASYQYVHDSISNGNLNTNSGQIGASVPFGVGAFLASYVYAKSEGRNDPVRATWAVGYDYPLSKLTDVYLAYMRDRVSDKSIGDSAGLGMRTSF